MTAAASTEDTAKQADADTLDDQSTVETDAGSESEDEGNSEAENLGDAGKKALDAMKAKWRTERDRAKKLQDELVAARKPPEAADKPDLDAMRQQARDEVRAESLRDKALDKIEAKAARLFKDPEDALLRLGKNVDDYIDDGKVDIDAINDALQDLLTKRPDFGLAQGEQKRFQGSADGGARGSAGKPQVTEEQLKSMTPEQIVQAQNEGRLTKLLGG